MMITLFHNPRCSKSRDALALLQQSGQHFEVVEYLKSPLNAGELEQLLNKLQLPARALLRIKEEEYKTLGLDDTQLSDAELISAMVKHPKLMERPVLVVNNKAAIGRPLENLQALLP